MSANVRIVNLAAFTLMLTSMVMLAGTAAARSGSSGFAHARHAWAAGTSRYVPDGRASRPFAADRYSPAAPQRQGAWYGGASRGQSWDTESRQSRHDYRQMRADNGYAQRSVAPATAAIPVQPAYAANAAVGGYGATGGNNLLSMAGLVADGVSALAQYMQADEMNETNPAYDEDY